MIITSASTLAYDEKEVHLSIRTNEGECICVGDTINIPMTDHTIEKRIVLNILEISENKKQQKRLHQISDGESGICIVRNVDSGKIHTVDSPWDDDPLDGVVPGGTKTNTNKYQIRFFFEWGGDYLWPISNDKFTFTTFAVDPIDPRSLGVPEQLCEQLDSLCDEYQTSLDWNNPSGPSTWTFDHHLDFERRTKQAYEELANTLKDTCDIFDCTGSMKVLAEKIVSAYRNDSDGYDSLFKQMIEDRYSWDSILCSLIFILLQPADDSGQYQYVADMIWCALCDGKELGIDKYTVIALLYGRLGNANDPYGNNTLWSIVSKADNLDYANSDYNPLKDDRILNLIKRYIP